MLAIPASLNRKELNMNIQMISLSQLVPSSDNVRKTGTNEGIESLAANIKAVGLLQNLQVRRTANGKYEVLAGARRHAALKLLVKHKLYDKDAEIACNVIDHPDGKEISLAENEMCIAMHPADQFEAFKALADEGKGTEEIAGRFGVTPTLVRQRLKRACVSPKLMQVYRDGEMSLDQLMAFTLTDDHTAQEASWFDAQPWNRQPNTIRANLTRAHVSARDARVKFLGIDAYVAAGGALIKDLFQSDHDGYLTDPALLDRLVRRKPPNCGRDRPRRRLEMGRDRAEARLFRNRQIRSIEPKRQKLSGDSETLDRLNAELDALLEQEQGDPGDDDETDASDASVSRTERHGKIECLEAEIEEIQHERLVWSKKSVALSGALVGIGHGGSLDVRRGLVRPEDKKALMESRHRDEDGSNENDEQSADSNPGLFAQLVEDLTSARTLALRAELLQNTAIALRSLAHALAMPVFYRTHRDSCVTVRGASSFAPDTESDDGKAEKSIAEAHKLWAKRLPKQHEKLWDWLVKKSVDDFLALLAYCTALTVNATQSKRSTGVSPAQVEHSHELADALKLDMSNWWQPTAETYLGRVSKDQIIEALREADKLRPYDVSDMKKAQLAAHAEKQLAGSGWLPAILRSKQAM